MSRRTIPESGWPVNQSAVIGLPMVRRVDNQASTQ